MSEEVQTTAAESPQADSAASPVAEEKPARRRATRTVKAASDAGETQEAATQDDSSLEKKPVRKTTRSRKPVSDAVEQPSASESAEPAEEKAPRPRRTRKAPAEGASPEDASAARPRRARKTAAQDAADAPVAASELAAAADGADKADETTAEASARPRARRRAQAEDAPSAQAAGDGPVEKQAPSAEIAAEEAVAGDAPRKRRARTRKASADATEAAPDAQAEAAEGSAAGKDAPEGENAGKSPASDKKEGAVSEDARPSQGQRREERQRKNAYDRAAKNDRGAKNGKQNDRRQNDRNAKNDRNEHRRQRRPHENRQNREIVPSVTLEELAEMKVADLRARAAELELDVTGLKKAELVEAVYAATLKAEGFIEVSGVLDVLSDGYGFLRTSGYLPGESDVYVGTSIIRRNGLRKGDYVVGQTRPARENEKFAAIQKIASVNGLTLEELKARPRFGDLTPVYPDECLTMEHGKNTITSRVIDLTSPIGKGQRGLIVSPPKAGKTTVLKDIAASISANNPEVHLICLLVDERPEEVTDMQRSIKGEVVSSTFDMPTENHITVAELVIERAKRLVEMGKDVVVLLDSLTRLARAYNLAQPASGRILSGGVDSTALYPPKKFLGAARNIEGGGSLTILASALVETGSKMDEVIFEEFKGTGNMELKLDRGLADRRIFPAIDPVASGTRKEELLLDPQEAPLIWAVRRILSNMNNTERAMDMLIKSLKQTETNQEFLIRTAKKAQTQHGKSDEGFGF